MVSKNNFKNKMEQTAARTPHYGIRKLSVGVASVLISTTLYMGATTAKADTLPSTATDTATTKPETASSSSSTQTNATADKTAKTTVPATASSTDTSVSTTPNAQASTTNTTAGATSSDKSGANSNSLVTNSVESTVNTTAQAQPKTTDVTSDKTNVDNQVGSNVENKATTTTDTISAPTTPKRVVRSLAAAPTTNSKELVENQDYTVSNVSLEDHKKQDNFDQDATFLHADIKAKNGDVIANKEITFRFNSKEFRSFNNLKNQDLIYNDQVIGNITGVSDWNRVFKVAFNDNTRGLKDINLSLKVYLSDNPYDMRDLYTNNQAKNNEKYTVRHNYQIGSTNYYVDREATIHYVSEAQPRTDTTVQFDRPIGYYYSPGTPNGWYPLSITYYTTKDGKTYAKIDNIPGKENGYDLGLGKGFITPDTKSVTISFEPSSKYYSKDANKLKIYDNATFDEKTVTYRTQYDSNDLVAGFTDVYTTMPKGINEVSDKHTYYVKDLIKLDGNTLIATDATTSTGLNNLSSRAGNGVNGYVGVNDANYTIVSSDDLRKFVIDNAAKIIETRGEFLTSNSDFSNPGRIVAHNNTTGQDVYLDIHNNVRVYNRDVTTPPDGAILVSAGKDIPTKVYSYTSTDIPSNVDKSKLTKEVTRTINVHNPNGTVDTTVQKVTYHQTVTVAGDEVIYNNDWTTTDNQSWDKVDVPQIEGYKASQTTVNQSWVNVNTQNQTVDITYTANPQSIKINYVDDEKGGASVKSDTLNGKTDETVKTGITIPENYNVVGTTPSEYTFKANGNTDITVHLKHVIDTTSEEKTVTRTIKVTDPTGKVTTIPQTAKVTRSVSTDKVTNQKTYGDWTTSSFDSYDVPLIEGYTATQSKVDTDTVTSDTQNSEVNISYTANNQAIKINYIDSDNNDSVVKSDILNGKTDQTVKTNINIPEGYTIEEQVPTDYTFKASGNTDITVKLKHGTTTVIPDNPKTTADKLPDNPSKTYPSGVGQNDLNKTVTRTIKITDSQGEVTTETQTVHLTRTATVDEVTGDITYGDWSTGSFDSYDVPVIEGYTATQSKVDTAKVTSNTQNSEINISYTANPQSIKINYVDDDKGGATVKSDTLNGKTDETVKTGITIPENYTVVGTTPSDYTFKAKDNADITVHLKHVIDTKSEEKTITRTIKVTNPNGGVMTIPQSAKSTRTVSTDKVTGEVTYGDWSKATLEGYDVPEIEGYTASQPSVDQTTVDGNVPDSEVNITYTANKQVISIDYVDNGKVISTQVLTGKTDETVKTNIQSPDKDKYVLVGTNPESYTFKAKDNADVRVEVKHVINDSTESKDVTRTIVVTSPDGKETTKVQKATVSRTVHTDAVTGDKTYDEWSKATLDKYNVPTVDGYTPSLNVVEGLEVDGNNEDSVVKVGYTANPQSIKVNYVDEDNGSSTVKTETLNGKTDQTVKTGIEIPDGYVVEGQVPTDYTFKAKDNADITVKLKHGTTTVTADNPKTTDDKLPDNPSKPYPSGVGQNDLNKDVTRTIKVTDPTGKVTTETQTVHLTRTATVDEVTGEVTYGDWTTGSFDSYDVPSVEGYTASQDKVERTPVTADSTNSEVNISYTANDQSIKINYVDNNGGTTVKSDTLNGKTDQTVKTGITIPDGYVVDGNVPTDYTFKAKDNADITVHLTHNNVTVTADNPKTTDDKLPDNPSKNYPSGVAESDLNKDIIRTINVTTPDGKTSTTIQTVHLTRNATVDEVTGDVSYSDWTTGSFDSYDVPSVEGYTASQGKVDTDKVTSDSTNSEVNISYTANDQTAKIIYVDGDNGGSTVKTDILNGKTDETVKTGIKVPDGYVVDGQIPADYTFKAKDNADVTVKLKHGTTTVTPDKPKTANDKLPDNPTKSYPSGVAENDLNKDVTRTINVTTPDGKTSTTTQTVHLTRTATVDEVTGEVAYSKWSTGSFDNYDVPVVEGYTASQSKVDTATVTSDTQNSKVNITYTANQQSIKINYVDSDNNDSVVKSDTLNGKTDQTVKTNINVPDGYVIEGNVPNDYTFKASGNTDITVKLKHRTTTVTPDNPKTIADKLPDNPSKNYPSGVAENDLNKTVTRTIKITDPKGKVTTTTQTVHLTRTATVDEVTGKVSYNDWSTGLFDSYDVPSVDGYTASQVKVDETKVTSDSTNNEVNITYTANPQSIKINYVDDTNGGTTVKSDTLNGKTDETVKTGITIPDGYEVEGQVPADYMFKAKDNADITVHLKHEIKTDTDYKNVLRTIKVTLPNGKSESLVQVATLSREVKTDKVTNNVSYGSWSSDKFTSYKLPSIEGYTPSLDVVNEAKVDGNTEDSTVEVNYTANKQSAKVVYVDNGKVVATQTLTGKTDQTVKTNIQSPDKDKYVVVGNNPENYTFKAKDNEDIKVEVKHVVNTFKDYKNVIRSIEVTYPNGKTEKLDQVATLERTVHKDAVTGEETYSDWSTENWDSFKAPEIKGYTADKDVKETVVTGDTTETTVSIVYTANEQATKIVYVDSDKSGSIVKTDTLNGKTDQTVKTDVKVPDGYVLEGNVPDNYTFTAGDNFDIIVHLRHGIVKVTPDKPKTTADKLPDSSKTYPEGVGQDDLNKTITRTIKVTTPDGKTSTTTQTAHLIRTARVDETTGQVTYDDWTTGSFDSYDVPSVDGYTASQAKVEETKVTSDSQDSEVNISYTANKQSIKVVYVDGDNSGSTVKTDTLTGKTDETVKTGIEIPDGYEVDGQVPSEYSFKAKDNADITVHLKHSTVTVIPDLPKTTEDKLPNNPSKSYPKGVTENDLNKTVVRTIKVTTPDGKTTTTKQTVKLNRVAVVDEVTGQVTYSKWSIGELDRYDVPSIEGYTPSQDRVNMEVATSETKYSVVEISYTPNGQSINITYVDDDKGKTTVDSYILAGKTDETVKTGIKIPDGYEVEGQVPTDYTFKAKDNTDITVRLKHKLDKGTETKTVSRIVEITLPDGQTKTIKQEQTLKRSKTTDLVTGDVVYGEWSKAEFDEVVAPEVDGYKPSQAKVEKETVDGNSPDQVVKITYKKVKSDVKVEAKPTVEAKHEAKVQVAPKVEAKASAKPQAKAQPKFVTTELPQTGEKQSKGTTVGAILVGLGSLLGLGALGKRKEK